MELKQISGEKDQSTSCYTIGLSLAPRSVNNMKMYVTGGMASHINFGIRRRCTVNFMPLPIYSREKRPWYPFNIRPKGLRVSWM
jgi:hypothetical protein